MKDILKLVRPDLLGLKPYSTENYEKSKIYLNANENPYPLKNAAGLNRYPVVRPLNMTAAMAAYYGVKPANILAAAGSDQIIDLITRAFCAAGKDAVLTCSPGFAMYGVYARIQGAEFLEVPLTDGRPDVKNIIKIIKTRRPKVFFLPNPYAPLGTLFDKKYILKIIEAAQNTTIIALDEAYMEFARAQSFIKYINKYPNLIILRTFSKAFALAGGRLGAAVSNADIINVLGAVLPPYPVSAATYNAAFKVLTDKKLLAAAKKNIDIIIKERKFLAKALRGIKAVKKVYPSRVNFIFIQTYDDKKIFDLLAANNIVVRFFEGYGLRITAGTRKESAALLRVLNSL